MNAVTVTPGVKDYLGSAAPNLHMRLGAYEKDALDDAKRVAGRILSAAEKADFFVRIDSAASNFNWWSAYVSSVDNRTGDGWVSHVH